MCGGVKGFNVFGGAGFKCVWGVKGLNVFGECRVKCVWGSEGVKCMCGRSGWKEEEREEQSKNVLPHKTPGPGGCSQEVL